MSSNRSSGPPSPPGEGLAWLLLGVCTWLLVGFGALVRARQAGLACPDWPLCFGAVIPDVRLQGVIYEFGHRALAGLIALAFATLAWRAWRGAAARSQLRKLLLAAAVVLLLQIVMGGLTVLIVARPAGAAARPAAWTVTTHLILGNAFAALVFAVGMRLRRGVVLAPRATVIWRGLLALWSVSLAAQFLLGGVVAANLAGLVCIEFPTCSGGIWFPSWAGMMGIQLLHRVNGVALVALGVGLAWSAGRGPHSGLSRLLAVAALLQVALGAANIWFALPPAVTVGHSAVASLLFVATGLIWDDRLRRDPA